MTQYEPAPGSVPALTDIRQTTQTQETHKKGGTPMGLFGGPKSRAEKALKELESEVHRIQTLIPHLANMKTHNLFAKELPADFSGDIISLFTKKRTAVKERIGARLRSSEKNLETLQAKLAEARTIVANMPDD
jgi:hypothetical protein